jgi:hypothetical protein
MLDKLDGIIGVCGMRDSFNGEEVRMHDERAAEKILAAGLERLGIGPVDLAEMKKGCPEKCGLAWLIRKQTCVTNEWIKRQLYMGKATNFSALIKRVEDEHPSIKSIMNKLKSIKISD